MIQTREYKVEDLMSLDIQDWQKKPEFELNLEYCEFLKEHSYSAITILSGDKVLSVGGVIELWPGRGEVWHLLSKDCGKFMLGIHRFSVQFLDMMNDKFPRLETGCEVGWPEAHRWLGMLGFQHECLARKYMPSGRDMHIYTRVK